MKPYRNPPTKSLKILLVITSLGLGGAERLLANLANSYQKRGHKVKVVFLNGEQRVMFDKGIEVIPFGISKNVFGLIKALIFLRSIIVNFKPDVVNAHLMHASLLCRLSRIFVRFPVLVSSAHTVNEESYLRMLIFRFTDFFSDISTHVSLDAANAFINQGLVPAGKIVHINNGVDVDLFKRSEHLREIYRSQLDIEANEKVLLCVGRLTVAKDYPNLFLALRILQKKGSFVKVFICGDGELDATLKKKVINFGLSDFVVFLGAREDVPSLMSACDVFVSSSAWEGLPLSIIEAMASEMVVVATDCGGIKSLVGKFGFVVPTASANDLAGAIERALKLSSFTSTTNAREAREYVAEHYSIDATASRYLRLFSRLLTKKSR